jgi:hypothetical protein
LLAESVIWAKNRADSHFFASKTGSRRFKERAGQCPDSENGKLPPCRKVNPVISPGQFPADLGPRGQFQNTIQMAAFTNCDLEAGFPDTTTLQTSVCYRIDPALFGEQVKGDKPWQTLLKYAVSTRPMKRST